MTGLIGRSCKRIDYEVRNACTFTEHECVRKCQHLAINDFVQCSDDAYLKAADWLLYANRNNDGARQLDIMGNNFRFQPLVDLLREVCLGPW